MDTLFEMALKGDKKALVDLFYFYGEEVFNLSDTALRGQLLNSFGSLLDCLYERERTVIKNFYGIGCKRMTLEEIGNNLDFTRERIRQIKERAIRKLKRHCGQNR